MKNSVFKFTIIWSLSLIWISCEKLDPVPVSKFNPSFNVSNLSYNSVNISVRFIDVAEGVDSYGHCWSESPNPTVDNFKTVFSGLPVKQVDYISNLKDLASGKKYYVRAYLTTGETAIYSEEIDFTTLSLKDSEGNEYSTVTIGEQIWMSENLKATKFNDGTNITYPGLNKNSWEINSHGAYAWYNNDEITYKENYGALYNWYAVNTGKLCPTGWRVPSDEDWKSLEMNLGMIPADANTEGTSRGTNEGSILSGNESLWINGILTSNSGFGSSNFSAIPGGYRDNFGNYSLIGGSSYLWTATQNTGNSSAYIRKIDYNSNSIARISLTKDNGFSVRCIQGGTIQPSVPNVTTSLITPTNISSVSGGGEVTSDGGAYVSSRGVCWSTSHNPSINDYKTVDGSGIGAFISSLTGLSANTTYYLRAYATNTVGTSYGNEICILSDIDENIYNTVEIGSQLWMRENLETTNYKNGISITYPGTNNTTWSSNTSGAYAWRDNTTQNRYLGAFYNWYAAISVDLCPTGWHVPDDDEWTTLENYLIANGYNYDGTTTGNKIAQSMALDSYWSESPNEGAVGSTTLKEYQNISGFSALPAGYRKEDGTFITGTGACYWWSVTSFDNENAYHLRMVYDEVETFHRNYFKHAGFSIRCLKD